MIRKLYYKLIYKLFLDTKPVMVRYRDEWIFIDYYGSIWRIKQTHDPSNPIIILCENKA